MAAVAILKITFLAITRSIIARICTEIEIEAENEAPQIYRQNSHSAKKRWRQPPF